MPFHQNCLILVSDVSCLTHHIISLKKKKFINDKPQIYKLVVQHGYSSKAKANMEQEMFCI